MPQTGSSLLHSQFSTSPSPRKKTHILIDRHSVTFFCHTRVIALTAFPTVPSHDHWRQGTSLGGAWFDNLFRSRKVIPFSCVNNSLGPQQPLGQTSICGHKASCSPGKGSRGAGGFLPPAPSFLPLPQRDQKEKDLRWPAGALGPSKLQRSCEDSGAPIST